MLSTTELTELDREYLWHPYTSFTNPSPVFPVRRAQGVHIELADGRKLIDGMSSWWSVLHGYNHAAINKAITDQLHQFAHVMFAGFTHEPAAKHPSITSTMNTKQPLMISLSICEPPLLCLFDVCRPCLFDLAFAKFTTKTAT